MPYIALQKNSRYNLACGIFNNLQEVKKIKDTRALMYTYVQGITTTFPKSAAKY